MNDIEKEFQFIKLQFINKYKCKRINNPSKIDYWKIFAKNDTRIALNILYTSKKMEAFIQLIFQKLIQIVKKNIVMIPNEEEKDWHCLTVKKISALLRGISSKHDGDFFSLHCLHSLEQKIKKYVKSNIFVKF